MTGEDPTADATASDREAGDDPADAAGSDLADAAADRADESPERSAVSDELSVPDAPPDPETADHVLPDEKLSYPDFTFEDGSVSPDGRFDLERSLDREGMREWLAELRGGLASHDVGVAAAEGRAIFGVGGGDVSVSFDPDDDHTGRLEFTFSIDAKLMTCSDDPDERVAGSRGGEGFIPLEMLTEDRAPDTYRCYNWIDDPTEGE